MAQNVNFDLMQPIRNDVKVVGQGRSESGVDGDPGVGFASAMNAVTNMKDQAQKRDQAAALFPDQLANSHMAEQQNEIILANEQDARRYQITKTAAAKLGPDNYFKALDPDSQQKYILDQQKIQKNISDMASVDAKTANQKLDNANKMTVMLANVASAAISAANPQSSPSMQQVKPGGANVMLPPSLGQNQQPVGGQPPQAAPGQLGQAANVQPNAQPGQLAQAMPQAQGAPQTPLPNQQAPNPQAGKQQSVQNANNVIQYWRTQLPPDMQKAMDVVFPNGQYNEQGAMAVIRMGTAQHLQAKENAEDKNPTLQLIDAAKTIQGRIQQQQQQGKQPDPTDIQNLQSLNSKIVADHNGKQGPSPSDDVQKALNGPDGKAAAAADASITPLKSFKESVLGVNQLLSQIPKGYVGPLTDLSKINGMSTSVQDLQHFQAKMGYLAKTIIANQSQGMRLTTAELTQLNKIVSGTSNNWDSIKDIMNDMRHEVNTKAHDAWSLSNRVRSGGNPDTYKTWQQGNPEPYNPEKIYQHGGKDVDEAAIDRAMAANPGKDEKWIIEHYGLTPKGDK